LLFALIDFLGWVLFSLPRLVAGSRPSPSSLTTPRSILLVQLDHLGDAVLTTGLLAALRARYPQARIEVLAAPWNREVFAACAEVQRVFVCHRNRFASNAHYGWPVALVYWAWRLRRRHYDLGIDVRGEFPHAALLWLAGVRRRIGWAAGGGGFLLTDSAEHDPTRHEAASRAAILDLLNPEPESSVGILPPRFVPSAAARSMASLLLAELDPLGSGPLVVLHVSAGTQAKRWPVGHWQELLGRLVLERGDLRMVLIGGPLDMERARQITGGLDWPNLANWTGRLSIAELAAVAERAAVVVGADSGPAHLAAAVNTPVVVLFSGTNDARVWKPVGPEVTVLRQPVNCSPCHCRDCPLADHPCMQGLKPERVAQAVLQQLDPLSELEPRPARLAPAWEMVPTP
jgi:heptosyltransferase-2